MNQQHPKLFRRYKLNPILTAADWPYPVHTVFNPAATPLPSLPVLMRRLAAQTKMYTRR